MYISHIHVYGYGARPPGLNHSVGSVSFVRLAVFVKARLSVSCQRCAKIPQILAAASRSVCSIEQS